MVQTQITQPIPLTFQAQIKKFSFPYVKNWLQKQYIANNDGILYW